MRTIKYLSPSAISKWEDSRDVFYIHYLSEKKRTRDPQEVYMAVGSAFDAFVKNAIHVDVFGKSATEGSQFDFQPLFESQVEPQCREDAFRIGQHLFDEYTKSGAYGHLIADIVQSHYAPQMEFTINGEVDGVPLLGKPDLRYITKGGIHVIADFKVNGSTSGTGASPQQGYKVSRDTYESRTHGKPHKKYDPLDFKGTEINGRYLNEFVPYWADQLAIYAWVLGEPVGGEDYLIRMEQIACRPVKSQDMVRAKCATHYSRIEKQYQLDLMEKIKGIWAQIQSGHIFDWLTRQESDDRCEMLDMQFKTPKGLHPALDFDEGRMRIG